MNNREAKLKKILITLSVLFFAPSIFAQSFITDRLPIGDVERKYNFCAVKLDKLFDTKLNKEISFSDMIEGLKSYRIVMIGESHTNQLHHDVQFEVIKGLIEAGQPVVLTLEMYNPKQNEVLAAWSSGETDPDTFMEQTGFLTTWSHNYRYYKAIFDYVREQHIPMYGVNVERKYTTKIGRGGIGSLTPEEIQAIPEIDTSTIEHKFLIKAMMQGMDATMPKQFNNMYPAQSLWDTAMGEGAIEAAKKHPDATVIVLAGSGHVVYNLGIGRIIKDRSSLPFASVVPVDIEQEVEEDEENEIKKDSVNVELTDEKMSPAKEETADTRPSPHSMSMAGMDNTPSRIVVRSYGDYLWGQGEMDQEKYPSLGLSLEDDESEGFRLKFVFPETIAYENGFKKADIILSIDGKSFNNSTELKTYLHFLNWGEEISFSILRDNEKIEITFIITPVEEKK